MEKVKSPNGSVSYVGMRINNRLSRHPDVKYHPDIKASIQILVMFQLSKFRFDINYRNRIYEYFDFNFDHLAQHYSKQ